MAQYVAQLLPDRAGAEALRKMMLAALSGDTSRFIFDPEEIDAIHEMYAKLTRDMREKARL